jgi:hypothetical protein
MREYLVSHGRARDLGRFRAAGGDDLGRGTAVVVRSRRGLELGEVLAPSPQRMAQADPFVGELVRPATAADLTAAARYSDVSDRLFDEGARLLETLQLPLALVDAEVLLDGRQALLHAVRLGPCEEGPLLSALGERCDLIVRFYDLTAEAEHDDGCGSCGSGGCGSCSSEGGCGSGGCGSCSSGGAKELAEYFAGLRAQMEQRSRVPLL